MACTVSACCHHLGGAVQGGRTFDLVRQNIYLDHFYIYIQSRKSNKASEQTYCCVDYNFYIYSWSRKSNKSTRTVILCCVDYNVFPNNGHGQIA